MAINHWEGAGLGENVFKKVVVAFVLWVLPVLSVWVMFAALINSDSVPSVLAVPSVPAVASSC